MPKYSRFRSQNESTFYRPVESRYSLELKTEISDPPTWVHFALVLSTLLAIVNIEWSFLALSQFCFAIALLLTNWKIGAGWALCLGDLGSDRNSSAYFLDGTARPRGISYMSGLIISDNISFKNYLGGSVVEAAIASILLWILLLIPFLTISGLFLLGKAITDF